MSDYRVLVVDDQRDIRRLLTVALKTMGPALDVIEVPSAEEAMLVSSRRPVNLLITDLSLPGISGLDLVKKFRARSPEIKIILITGMTDTKTRKLLDAADVDAFYYKPVEMTDFLANVERLLGISGLPAGPIPSAGDQAVPKAVAAAQAAGGVPAEVSGYLTSLRDRFKADSVTLLDPQGSSLAACGEASSAAAHIPALVALGQAGLNAARQMGQATPENLFFLNAPGRQICLALVGAHMLVLVGSETFRQALLGENSQPLAQAAAAIQDLLTAPVVVEVVEEAVEPAPLPDERQEPDPLLDALLLSKVEEVAPEEAEAALAELDALFGTAKELPSTDVDHFWDTVVDESDSVKTNENVITWEEARDLGLTPD